MPNIPDQIVIKEKKELQSTLYVISTFMVIGGGVALFGNGHGMGFFVAVAGFILAKIASNIKTTKHFRGGAGLYK